MQAAFENRIPKPGNNNRTIIVIEKEVTILGLKNHITKQQTLE